MTITKKKTKKRKPEKIAKRPSPKGRPPIASTEAPRQSERRYRALFENMQEGFAYCRMLYDEQERPVDFVYLDVNRAFELLTGLKNVVEKPVSEVIPGIKESSPELFESYGRVASTGKPERFEFNLKSLRQWLSISVYSPERGYFVAVFENITERKRAEEALQRVPAELEQLVAKRTEEVRESAEKHRALFDGSSNPIAVYDRDGYFLMINSLGAENFRKPATEIVGKSLKELLPDAYELLVERIRRVIDQKENFQAEDLIKLPGGEERWFWSTLEPVKNLNGAIYGVQIISYDITERKRAEEALQRAHEQLEQLVEERTEKLNRTNEALRTEIAERKRAEEELKKSSQLLRDIGETAKVGGWELDLSTKEVLWTEEVGRIHGVEPGYKPKLEEAMNFYAPESRPALEEVLKKAAETGEPYDLESLFIPSGSKDKIWVRSLGKAVYSGGKIVKLAGTFQNIDKYKRAEEALRESEEKYRNLVERANDGIVIVQDGIIKYINARLAEMRGVTVEEVIGTPFTDHIYPDELPEVVDRYKRRVAGEDVSPIYETALRRRDGSKIHAELNAGMVTYQGKPADLVIIRDITERKRAEEEIRRKAKDLQEKNAELTRFIYAVSHDLRSPLVTIQTFQGHLERDIRSQDAARVEKDLGYIRNAADKMGRLLNELLRFSRVGRIMNPSEEAPLQAIVKEALDLVAGRITGRGVRVDLTEEPVVLYGDRTRLVEVFLNLLDNAVKFMGDEPAPRVEIGVEQAGEELVLHVRDNGIGIDPRLQPMLFGLFHKLDPETEGEGIGLALVKQIVELHGGRIWVESAGIGTGATFRFTLAKTRRKRGREETP